MHPPQTYSRLFRPWDNNNTIPELSTTPEIVKVTQNKSLVKSEYGSSMEDMSISSTSLIKPENLSFSGNESDRECSSSNSLASYKSYDESFNNVSPIESDNSSSVSPLMPTTSAPNMHPLNYPAPRPTHMYGAFDPHMPHAPTMHLMRPSPSELYYAAAAAAAAAGMPSVGPATPPSASAYALDPYSMSMMEQEYARVMAEEAHLKAVNARKQRPKKFKCPHCDVAFSNNGQLKGHIRIHTGERPFKCDVETCGKTFTRNEELTRHKRIHTGLRPYPCTTCGKKFGRRDHLKKHMKTHMPQERAAIFLPVYPYLYGY